MDLEQSEHEPEEYDPEEEFHDPDSESLTIPSAPEIDASGEDLPANVRVGFWLIVATLKVAILAVSVGALVLVLGDWSRVGLAGLVGGLLLFALAGRRFRSVQRTIDDNELDTAAVEDEP